MLTVEDFRKKYPSSTEEQVQLYGQAVAAERARGPLPMEPDVPMPMITVAQAPPSRDSPSPITTYSRDAKWYGNLVDPSGSQAPAPDLTTHIRRVVLGRRLTARERAQAERPDMTGDDLLALLAGVPNAREWEALEGGD